jgi:predicted 2-oxoglutarate/Fe(II)-dependent dioxygenase YbiX
MTTINKRTIPDVLSEDRCQRLIVENSPLLTPAMFWTNGERIYDPNIREAYNYKFRDPELAEISCSIVSRFSGHDVDIARVEHVEIACYPPGNGNERHLDGPHRSHSIVYFLNVGYSGGELVFDDGSVFRDMPVGSAVVWENGPEAFHACSPIVRGLKWILVSWIRRPEAIESELEIHTAILEANEAAVRSESAEE